MDDLISRKEAKDAIYESFTPYQSAWAERIRQVWNAIDSVPTVEAVQVVHGEWLDFYGDYSTAECDQCAECYEVSPDSEPKKEYFEAFKQCYNFCPNCGADMRKKV